MTTPVECLRCRTPMDEGVIADRALGSDLQAKWSPGELQQLWDGLAIDKKAALPVITLRCPRC